MDHPHHSAPHVRSHDERVFRKEEHHGDCHVVQWLNVYVFGWSLGRDMGIVAAA
jgi:hypothetical protein